MDTITLADVWTYKKLKPYEGLEGRTPIVNGHTYVGVEIELEEFDNTNTPATWSKVKDDSLKLDGQELITIPIKFKYLEVELDRLIQGIVHYHASTRCSIHIHLNIRDMTKEELNVFLLLYLIFEKSLFKFTGDRWKSNYCTPLYNNPDIVSNFIKAELGFNNYNTLIWYKYSALNLSPIFGGESTKLGTAEFRHLKGNLDKELILNWCNLIVSLKTAAKNMTLLSLHEHIETMNTTSGYYWLAEHVFTKWSRLLTTQETFKDDVESCITRTKYMLLHLKEDVYNLPDTLKSTKQQETNEKLALYAKQYANTLKNVWETDIPAPINITPNEVPKANKPLDLSEKAIEDLLILKQNQSFDENLWSYLKADAELSTKLQDTVKKQEGEI